jgi:hypothetical protein
MFSGYGQGGLAARRDRIYVNATIDISQGGAKVALAHSGKKLFQARSTHGIPISR